MTHNGNPLPYLLLALLIIGSTIFSTIQAIKNGARWGEAFLGVGVVILGILLFMVLLA